MSGFFNFKLLDKGKKDIRTFTKEALTQFFIDQGKPSFRGAQVYQWLWQKGLHEFDAMTNLPLEDRALLKAHFDINHIKIDTEQKSKDGTVKNAIKLHDDLVVESVLIPTSSRSTACVSSQVGCSLDCTFCATASMKRMRNLNPDEIYDQVITLNAQSQKYYQRPLSNIVFMGMGEPLMNYKNILTAIDKITTPEGLGMSPKRITVSTSGIPKMICKLADAGVKFKLAVSLHSARQEVRAQIMPFATKFPLEELLDSLRYWYERTKSKITFEYVVWENVNDTKEDIQALVQFCLKVPSKVNLIQYNPIAGNQMRQASAQVIDSYIKLLSASHIQVTYRKSRGKDIDAACGQLANK